MKVKELIDIAKAEIGTKENPKGSNCVKYNDWFYNKAPGVIRGSAYPWCAAFVSWCFRLDPSLIKKSNSSSEIAKGFKKNQQWYTTPKVGDVVFFNYSHPNAIADHVGIVIEVNGNKIKTIEGNTSMEGDKNGSQSNGGIVAVRTRVSNIVGYGRPAYEDGDSIEKGVNVNNYPTLRKGDKGAWVTLMQNCLNAHGFECKADGDFGIKTYSALTAFQSSNKYLKPDGICGRLTWTELAK